MKSCIIYTIEHINFDVVSSIEVVHVFSLCHVLLSGGGGHGVVLQ